MIAWRAARWTVVATAATALCACSDVPAVTEFCLTGEFDLGARYQGLLPAPGERYSTQFCYVVDDDRVLFRARGHSNPDMRDDWSVAFLPPDTVRIVNRDSPPDIEFSGKSVVDEALRYRRVDPRRFVAEIQAHPEWVMERSAGNRITLEYPPDKRTVDAIVEDGKLRETQTMAEVPLRGRVPVTWRWLWTDAERPEVTVLVENDVVFVASGSWRALGPEEARELWHLSGDQDPVDVPGDRWPSRIDLRIDELGNDAYFVKGVRSGFGHIVINTAEGLIVGDAPAGWLELQQVPPADLVPGFEISGLSENFIDFLGKQFPDVPIHAVALTHAHDDHAGGARAFAAAGADVYAPQGIADFLQTALNRPAMPPDRLSEASGEVSVIPVAGRLSLASGEVELIVLPKGPHVDTALGVYAKRAGIFFQSDLHVPRSDDDTPRDDRVATECWFANWAVDNLPAGTVVINSHTPPQTPVSRLAKYLESTACES